MPPWNLGLGFGGPGSEQVEQVTTIFKNLRYYLISNMRQPLSQAYAEIGLVQTLVDIPVDDALRGGIEIKSKQLSEEQLQDLATAIERDNDLVVAGEAGKWNRLFGGAGIVILTDQDPETPLDVAALSIGDRLEFRAADMWELFFDKQAEDGYDPSLQAHNYEFYSYYGTRVHKSRVLKLKGITAPSFIRPRLRGWGVSVVEILVRSINQYLKATDLGFEVLDEFKLDVYRIKDLVATLLTGAGGEQAVLKRIAIANYQKNYQNAVVLDAEDEYENKQLSFTGLAEAMDGIRTQVCADMRFTPLKLFGIPAKGMNASDQESMDVYNSMVESQVRNKLRFTILQMLELKCQVEFGFVPDDLMLAFKPLRVMSAEQEENVRTQKFNRVIQAQQAGLITSQEFRDACNKSGLFDITLDAVDELDEELPAETEPEEDQTGDQDEEQPAVENSIEPYSRYERAVRLINSPQFDKASYEADGGDAWIDPRRKEFFANPGKVDERLWAKAKKASMDAFGEERWQFVTWWYKKQGGKFN